jgi:hypothetical protein
MRSSILMAFASHRRVWSGVRFFLRCWGYMSFKAGRRKWNEGFNSEAMRPLHSFSATERYTGNERFYQGISMGWRWIHACTVACRFSFRNICFCLMRSEHGVQRTSVRWKWRKRLKQVTVTAVVLRKRLVPVQSGCAAGSEGGRPTDVSNRPVENGITEENWSAGAACAKCFSVARGRAFQLHCW